MHHRPKSPRHQRAPNARWRAAERRAEAERHDDIPDREPYRDGRAVIELDLTTYGGPRLRIEPRAGYISVRVIDADTGRPLYCCALKTALHRVADSLPRTTSPRRIG